MCLYLQKFSWTSNPTQGMNPDNLTELCPAQSCWGIPINLRRCAPYLYHILHIARGTESIASQFPKKIHFSNCISPGSTLKNYTYLLILHESTLLRQCKIDLYMEGFYVLKVSQAYKSLCTELAPCRGASSTLGTGWNPRCVSSWRERVCEASRWPGNCTAFETRYWTFSHLFAVSRLVPSSAGGFPLI